MLLEMVSACLIEKNIYLETFIIVANETAFRMALLPRSHAILHIIS